MLRLYLELTSPKLLTSQRQTLESRLCNTQSALNDALSDRERLLLEVRKYDPTFTL